MININSSLRLWFDSEGIGANAGNKHKIDILRCLPFILTHVVCLAIFWVPFSLGALLVLLLTYSLRVFALTAFYHRYFSHRAFKTSRIVQFIFAFIGTTAAQRGPLWWSAHHRFHHKHSDKELDRHSPHVRGFLWSHCGWFLLQENFSTDENYIKDLVRYKELQLLNRFDSLPPILLCILLYLAGGFVYVFWGYFISTVLVYHVTFSINSFGHIFGKRTFKTTDQSRNNWLLAILAFGEGWHNNHHYCPSSARQGISLLQIDISYMILKIMEKMHLIWDIRGFEYKYQQVEQAT